MIIEIPPQYRIKALSDCWAIQRKGKREWECFEYYPRISQALKSTGERLLRESNAMTHEDVLNAISRTATALNDGIEAMVAGLGFDSIKEFREKTDSA